MIPGEAQSGAETKEDLRPRSMVGMKDRLMLGAAALELRYLVRVRPSSVKSQLKDCIYLSNTSRWESRHQSDSSVLVQPSHEHTSPTFMRNCYCLHVSADVVSNQTMPLSLSPSVPASCLMFFRLTCGAVDADEEATFMCRS